MASRILYGDDLETDLMGGVVTPTSTLIDVPVFGTDTDGEAIGITELHLAKALDLTIPQLPPSTRVLNLSLGTGIPVYDDHFSLVAQVLDRLSRVHNILVVVTAGNISRPSPN